MQPLPLYAYHSAETTTDKDEVTEGFGDMMLELTVKSGGQEIIEDDYIECVDDDGYSTAEVIDGEYFECIK